MQSKKLYRSKTNRILFGVAGGLGEYFGIDPTIVRIIFVVLTIWGGLGLILYIIGIFIIPEEKGNEKKNNKKEEPDDFKNQANEAAFSRTNPDQIVGLVILILGLIFLFSQVFTFNFWRFWPLILVIVGIVILLNSKREKK